MLNNLTILTTRDLQNICSFQLTFRFHMLFLIFKVHIISIQQIEQFWSLETYKLFVPAQKQLAHPLFSSYSVVSLPVFSNWTCCLDPSYKILPSYYQTVQCRTSAVYVVMYYQTVQCRLGQWTRYLLACSVKFPSSNCA